MIVMCFLNTITHLIFDFKNGWSWLSYNRVPEEVGCLHASTQEPLK